MLAARKFARIATGKQFHADGCQHVLHPPRRLRLADAVPPRTEPHVVRHGHVREQRVMLEHGVDRPQMRWNGIHAAVADAYLTGRSAYESGDGTEQRVLPHPLRPHRQEFARRTVSDTPLRACTGPYDLTSRSTTISVRRGAGAVGRQRGDHGCAMADPLSITSGNSGRRRAVIVLDRLSSANRNIDHHTQEAIDRGTRIRPMTIVNSLSPPPPDRRCDHRDATVSVIDTTVDIAGFGEVHAALALHLPP